MNTQHQLEIERLTHDTINLQNQLDEAIEQHRRKLTTLRAQVVELSKEAWRDEKAACHCDEQYRSAGKGAAFDEVLDLLDDPAPLTET